MVDSDRDPDRDRTVEREHTTVVDTGGDRGGGGALAVVLLIIAVLVLLYLFRDSFGFGGETTEVQVPDEINVNVQ